MAAPVLAVTIPTFFGNLGSGKTAFVRGVASVLCKGAHVSSPTYAIVNEYRGDIPVFHFDMYRISDEGELYSIGFYDYMDEDAILVIEWSENIADFFYDNNITITFEKLGETTRKITVEGVDCNW